ncbi:MAG: cell division protein SepF, partial [Tissierellia bacterium]|nr:cell division protein SepF [Tissierellia bacterium]
MSNFMDKFKYIIGIDDYDFDEDEEEQHHEEEL